MKRNSIITAAIAVACLSAAPAASAHSVPLGKASGTAQTAAAPSSPAGTMCLALPGKRNHAHRAICIVRAGLEGNRVCTTAVRVRIAKRGTALRSKVVSGPNCFTYEPRED